MDSINTDEYYVSPDFWTDGNENTTENSDCHESNEMMMDSKRNWMGEAPPKRTKLTDVTYIVELVAEQGTPPADGDDHVTYSPQFSPATSEPEETSSFNDSSERKNRKSDEVAASSTETGLLIRIPREAFHESPNEMIIDAEPSNPATPCSHVSDSDHTIMSGLHSPWIPSSPVRENSFNMLDELDIVNDDNTVSEGSVSVEWVSGSDSFGYSDEDNIEFEVPSTIGGDWDHTPLEDLDSTSNASASENDTREYYCATIDETDEAEIADNSDFEVTEERVLSPRPAREPRACHYCKEMTKSITSCCLSCFKRCKQWLPHRPPCKRKPKSQLQPARLRITRPDTNTPSGESAKYAAILVATCEKQLRIPEAAVGGNLEIESGSLSTVGISGRTIQLPDPGMLESQESGYGGDETIDDKPLSSPQNEDGIVVDIEHIGASEIESERTVDNKILESAASPIGIISEDKLCSVCYLREKSSAFVHYKTAHLCCCHPCADKILRDTGKCPICRKKILRVVKVIEV